MGPDHGTLTLQCPSLLLCCWVQLPKTAYITSFGAMVIASYVVFFALILEAVVVCYVSSVVRHRPLPVML